MNENRDCSSLVPGIPNHKTQERVENRIRQTMKNGCHDSAFYTLIRHRRSHALHTFLATSKFKSRLLQAVNKIVRAERIGAPVAVGRLVAFTNP